MSQLADILLDKEVIFKDDLEKIFGKRPYDKIKEEGKPVKETNTLPDGDTNSSETITAAGSTTDAAGNLTEKNSVNK